MQLAIKQFHVIRPFVSAMLVLAITAGIVFAIYFSENEILWIPFLAGILVAAVLVEATTVSITERVANRRAEQLTAVKSSLDRELYLRESAEEALAASKSRLILIDEELPIMVALIDSGGVCQYYNRAFMEWLHLQPQQIIGKNIRTVLGAKIFREVATAIRQSLDGHPIHYERMQIMPDRKNHRLFIEHIPQYSDDGKVTGFYMLVNDITTPGNVDISNLFEPKEVTSPINDLDMSESTREVKTNRDMFVADPFTTQTNKHDEDAKRVMKAIESGEYRLLCQLIAPATSDLTEVEHYEILVRLKENEKNMMSPGEFFPLAEMNGRMLHLDRWVVEHVTKWASRRQSSSNEKRKDSMFFINISDDSISDPSFPEFLKMTLQDHCVPGPTLGFEIPAAGLILRNSEITEFVHQVKKLNCRIAISGFGQDPVLFDLIQNFKVDLIKIDGAIIRNILQDNVDLAAVQTIVETAKEIGVKTVAELVENEETIIKLQEIGINFAQGYGISWPRPLAD
ncbi:MAG: EAL domain-containing protein [Gammaproteobacteria bacterium]